MQRSSRQHWVSILTLFRLISLLPITCFIVFAAGNLYANESTVWNALKSGSHFAFLRHAIAPGTGDPPYFELGECSTQRNLSKVSSVSSKKVFRTIRRLSTP
jgi:hypothetical protein